MNEPNPFPMFAEWMRDATRNTSIKEPTAMSLATVGEHGAPSVRIVLLKEFDERGFVFYTNSESRKGDEIRKNRQVALCFYWMPLLRQVRIEGKAGPVSKEEADAYFASRPRDSQIGAWASHQSRPLASRARLEEAVKENTILFEGKDVPRPPYWYGWRVVPNYIEFWEEQPFRLHDRETYTRDGNAWKVGRLYP